MDTGEYKVDLTPLYASVREAAEFAAMTLREFGETVGQWSVPLRNEWSWFIRAHTPDDVPEIALREYARRLNLFRRWRKVNWRHLNRDERAAAYWDWYSRTEHKTVTTWHTNSDTTLKTA